MDDARSKIAHLYRRAGFGARPDELDAAVASGYQSTVESLLAGLSGPDTPGDKVQLPMLVAPSAPTAPPAPPSVPATPSTLPAAPGQDAAAKAAANRKRQMAQTVADQALQTWWLNRMIVTTTPLREKMTLLWHGHFATGFEKVRDAALMYRQNQLFRTMAGGNFEALTQAIAKDPAMMLWLDTQTDVAGHPNENFARELMELFTLGLGNYSEDDVKQAARCFTGWSIDRASGVFVFRPRRHDFGTKTLLGHTGTWNGEDAVHIVTRHPVSARWIAAKLWSHLAYPTRPDDPIIAELAVAYGFDLDVTKLLRAIFLHPEFTGAKARGGLVKQPIEYVVGVSRAFGLDAVGQPRAAASGTAGLPAVAGAPTGSGRRTRPGAAKLPAVLRGLAQQPFSPPSVGGWPQNEYWLTTASAQLRLQYGYAVGLTADLSALAALAPAERPAALAHLLSIDGWGPTTSAALNHVAADPPTLVAIALSAPEYVLN